MCLRPCGLLSERALVEGVVLFQFLKNLIMDKLLKQKKKKALKRKLRLSDSAIDKGRNLMLMCYQPANLI